jgi:hypothetical protein
MGFLGFLGLIGPDGFFGLNGLICPNTLNSGLSGRCQVGFFVSFGPAGFDGFVLPIRANGLKPRNCLKVLNFSWS